jgi:hypothetical protein
MMRDDEEEDELWDAVFTQGQARVYGAPRPRPAAATVRGAPHTHTATPQLQCAGMHVHCAAPHSPPTTGGLCARVLCAALRPPRCCAADRPTSIHHWQLRDLISAGDNETEFFCVYEQDVYKYNSKTHEVGGLHVVCCVLAGSGR